MCGCRGASMVAGGLCVVKGLCGKGPAWQRGCVW